MRIGNSALRAISASAEHPKDGDSRLVPSSAGGVFRGSKRTCADSARWRLVRGQPAQRLSAHYRLECDYGTSILDVYKEGDPVFLCEGHVAAIAPRDSCIAGVRPIDESSKVDVAHGATEAGIATPELKVATSEESAGANLGVSLESSVPDLAIEQPLLPFEARTEALTEATSAVSNGHADSSTDLSNSEVVDRHEPALGFTIAAEKPSAEAEGEAPPRRSANRPRRDTTISVSRAAVRDPAYGNPAKALVDETIWNMAPGDVDAYRNALAQGKTPLEAAQAAGGQLAVVHRKIAEYVARIEPILSASKATISVGYAIDKPLEQAMLEIMGSTAMAEAEKDAAVDHLGEIQKQIKTGLDATVSPLQAHLVAQEIAKRANWGGNSALPEEVKRAYSAIYARLRDALRAFVPEARELDGRLANLYVAKSDLEDTPSPKTLHSTAV